MGSESGFIALSTVAAAVLFVIFGVALLRRKRCYALNVVGTVIAAGGLVVFSRFPHWPGIEIVAALSIWLYAACFVMASRMMLEEDPRPGWRLVAWIAALSLPLTVFRAPLAVQPFLILFGVGGLLVEWMLVVDRGKPQLPPEVRSSFTVILACIFLMVILVPSAWLVWSLAEGKAVASSTAGIASMAFSYLVFLMVVLNNLAIGLDLALTHEDLRQKNGALSKVATTDKLTGVFNRVHFDAQVVLEINRAQRLGERVSLILVDMDWFKTINDRYGHQAGDEVLRRAADLARSVIRSTDMIFRWGGEEFAILAPGTGIAGALSLAEKLRTCLATGRFPVPHQVTASFGVAEFRPGSDLESWFKEADEAMYRAKSLGRNRVESCP